MLSCSGLDSKDRKVYKLCCVQSVFGLIHLERRKESGGKMKRVQVSFTEEQWKLIERFRGVMGTDDAEIVRNIVLSWLAEKSLIASAVKEGAGRRDESV